jgi:hypothetical protein
MVRTLLTLSMSVEETLERWKTSVLSMTSSRGFICQFKSGNQRMRSVRVGLLTWKSLTGIAKTVQKHRTAETRTRDRNNIRREDERKKKKVRKIGKNE